MPERRNVGFAAGGEHHFDGQTAGRDYQMDAQAVKVALFAGQITSKCLAVLFRRVQMAAADAVVVCSGEHYSVSQTAAGILSTASGILSTA